MGRGRFGHQSADERRRVRTVRATTRFLAFGREIGARYRRTAAAWLRPASTVLRTAAGAPAPGHRHFHVTVPMRTVRETIVRHAVERLSMAAPYERVRFVQRLTARTARVEPAWRAQVREQEEASSVAGGRRPVEPTLPPMVRPARMELARPAARPDAAPARRRPDGNEIFESAAAPRRAAASVSTESLDADAVTRLTDRVVAAIDRRLTASRERVRA
jgi:hypothetical protein